MNTSVSIPRLAAALLSAAFVPFATAQMAGQATAATNVAATAAANAAANAVAARTTAANAATVAASNVNAAAQTVSANVANAATNAAAQAQTGVQNAATAATNVASAADTVSAAGNLSGSASASADHSGMNAGATTGADASLKGQTASADPDLNTSITGSATLDTRATAEQIRTAIYETRSQLAANVEAGIDAAKQAVAGMRSHATELSGQARASFQAAVAESHAKEAQVRASLRTMRTCGAEKFEEARSNLASDFDAYASAVAQVQATGAVSGGKN